MAVLLALSGGAPAAPQEPGSASLEAEASAAAEAGDYTGAAAILRRGRALWPEDPRLPVLLGDLYTDRSLHSLALDEYRDAERLDPSDPETIQRIADAYGFLNREEDSILYLRRILDKDPGNLRAAGDLGWMLFKTHRLQEGAAFLEGAEARIGPDIGFSMTLGTLRAELLEYDEARRRYEEAIAGARAEGYGRFAAVAYYNLSLLESRFRRWDRALEAADQSLLMEARSSGYLARGELRLRRMELDAAFQDFTSAFGADTTPLARLGLAEAALAAGRLDEALTWVGGVSRLEEHPWMASFGTNPDSFAMDIHELLRDIHRGKAMIEKARPKRDLFDAAGALVRGALEGLRAAYHEALFRKGARSVAAAYAREGAELPAASHGYTALGGYPRLAARYLRKSQQLEEARIPEARPANELETAVLARDAGAMEAALAALDPVWERDLAEEGLAALAEVLPRRGRRGEAYRSALERLWLVNPGALPRRGFTVPALLRLEADPEIRAGALGSLRRRLRGLGWKEDTGADLGAPTSPGAAPAFELRLSLDASGVEYVLVRRSSGAALRRGRLALGAGGSGTRVPAGEWAYEIADFIWRDVHSR